MVGVPLIRSSTGCHIWMRSIAMESISIYKGDNGVYFFDLLMSCAFDDRLILLR